MGEKFQDSRKKPWAQGNQRDGGRRASTRTWSLSVRQRRVPLILRRGSHERPSHAAVSEAVPSWTAGEGSRNKKPWWMRASPDHPLILVWWHPQNLTPKFINVFIKYKHGIIKKPKLSGVHCAVNTLSLRWFRTAFNPSPRVDLQDKTENYWFVSLFLMHYV